MGGGGGSESGERKLDQTPTWAVAGVCAVIILISFVLEKGLHRVGTWLTKKQKRALYEALEKVKGELMVLGFISLLLTFSQSYISRICIPSKVADTMLPCKPENDSTNPEEEHRRRLLWNDRRALSSDSSTETCKPGYEPLITVEAAHQLHILIFFLAVFHIRGWKEWERETLSLDYEFTNHPSNFRLTHETSFVKAHTSFWTRLPIFFYVVRSVTKADYLTLRNGFITPCVMGIFCDFLVFKCWHTLFWASILPLLIIFAVGTKLQAILANMALEITERHVVILLVLSASACSSSAPFYSFSECIPDNILLVDMAQCIGMNLAVIHNFQINEVQFGVLQDRCFGSMQLQYSSTMGSHMKKSIFDEQTSKALHKWHMAVKRKQEEKQDERTPKPPPSRTLGGSSKKNSLKRYSSGPSLHRFMTMGHLSRTSTYDGHGGSNQEDGEHSTLANLIVRVDPDHDHDNGESEMSKLHIGGETRNGGDIQPVKPDPKQ
ncbi:hypothetical protein Cgig2_009815 [Carnegiea gigantea]|uniref:MLO-like protein n=1 Tax=Carnegiea gigantea TaxID=171969 RepID=A0A9Q1JQ30_9CARY|nr:hypothetical protein Cgig2_009815 [Carnegiea gigantea]